MCSLVSPFLFPSNDLAKKRTHRCTAHHVVRRQQFVQIRFQQPRSSLQKPHVAALAPSLGGHGRQLLGAHRPAQRVVQRTHFGIPSAHATLHRGSGAWVVCFGFWVAAFWGGWHGFGERGECHFKFVRNVTIDGVRCETMHCHSCGPTGRRRRYGCGSGGQQSGSLHRGCFHRGCFHRRCFFELLLPLRLFLSPNAHGTARLPLAVQPLKMQGHLPPLLLPSFLLHHVLVFYLTAEMSFSTKHQTTTHEIPMPLIFVKPISFGNVFAAGQATTKQPSNVNGTGPLALVVDFFHVGTPLRLNQHCKWNEMK